MAVVKPTNRDRILEASVGLFNRAGTVATTTNHISEHLHLSPGNLYFHFRNKEEIVRILFDQMCEEIYECWEPGESSTPQKFVAAAFEIFWNYRFFHREMYHLRRQDADLSAAWKKHLRQCYLLVKSNYRHWQEERIVRPLRNNWEMKVLTETILLSSTSYLTFYESPDKTPSKRAVRLGLQHLKRLLTPYLAVKKTAPELH